MEGLRKGDEEAGGDPRPGQLGEPAALRGTVGDHTWQQRNLMTYTLIQTTYLRAILQHFGTPLGCMVLNKFTLARTHSRQCTPKLCLFTVISLVKLAWYHRGTLISRFINKIKHFRRRPLPLTT